MALNAKTPIKPLVLACLCANSSFLFAEKELEEVLVTADFRDSKLSEMAASVDVIGHDQIELQEARHIESLLNSIPNVNYSSGASRGRFFQIRGIGERSQFVEPVNPSVGVLVDGVDMSGIAGAATLLDTEQVEVLRGPQGTLYGANALAGLINIKSQEPTEEFTGRLKASVAEFNTRQLAAVMSGPISDTVSYRIAAQDEESDGYMENRHLGRDDTADIDEKTVRAKLRITPSDELRLDLTALYVDVDNGYDHFTLDNSRNTLSDEPGHDRQETKAVSAQLNWQFSETTVLDGSVSIADSDMEYGYDEDWTFVGIHPEGYSSTDNYIRQRDNKTADIRLMSSEQGRVLNGSSDWLIGVYAFDQDESLRRQYTYLSNDFLSDFSTERQAIYGQLDSDLSDDLYLSVGARFEKHRNRYNDSNQVNASSDENLWGGKVSLSYHHSDNGSTYALVSRGYKSGGFNTDGTLPAQFRSFDTEVLWNYELGYKFAGESSSVQLAFFYQDREDVQIKSSNAVPRPDGSTEFVDFIDNSAEGESYGLELSSQWQLNESLNAFANLGLLETELNDTSLTRNGGEVAHAPTYQAALGFNLDLGQGWFTSADVQAKDEFFFSDSHNAQSEAFVLLNAKLGYRHMDWELSLWGKNLGDEDVRTRGFSFGNDPRNGYAGAEYFQFAAPRQIGVSGEYRF
ncbi:TonB-dependent receptor [Pseudoteredinibacter isoporae]|uniref:Outer membrane receptor protein involved in Fe transport n=1 Tax=Pseudoteredinibacter isoporae TaxID=570281 RepID=A0A7X0MVY5_9GAMM|nr:TonB-dependent receptor [Pseudoteredinibacter isoporae]MBB6521625.1 outer membrane receptor protein involved in Fe transport [Pseudoteredinibacter isoporae]NHO87179.1 TonB-dependent receptor [Pseudoteredinibacter isoporae]NIB23003.1 TonB-dependent receptor [Pseudoteredinibacter isoporae]